MNLDKRFYINTGKSGLLDSTTTSDIDEIFRQLHSRPRIILYFHGGLVSREAGMGVAAKLLPGFLSVDTYPIFFVYESGFLEILKANLAEISSEDVFKSLLQRLLKFTVSKLRDPLGARGLTSIPPTDIELHKELEKRKVGEEPFRDEPIYRGVSEVAESEQRDVRKELAKDRDLMQTIEAIGATTQDAATNITTRGLTTQTRKSARTLMSPEVVDQIKTDVETAQAAGSRGVLSTAALLYRAGKILVRIIERFRRQRDHGIYPTVVEEILREFYVANIGTVIWEAIKAETSDTFVDTPGQQRGGVYFLNQLTGLLAATPKDKRPEISLVGHSTGAVFINNLLSAVGRRQQSGAFPQDFSFRHIVFLAPACTFWSFDETIRLRKNLFSSVRIFGMTDEVECRDAIVPLVYTRSLLYFVSGLLEKDFQGKAYADVPLVGMQRFYTNPNVYGASDESDVRNYVSDSTVAYEARRWVWSPSDDGAGLNSHSQKHGEFDDDPSTLESVLSVIK